MLAGPLRYSRPSSNLNNVLLIIHAARVAVLIQHDGIVDMVAMLAMV